MIDPEYGLEDLPLRMNAAEYEETLRIAREYFFGASLTTESGEVPHEAVHR